MCDIICLGESLMVNFYLDVPSLKWKDEIVDYVNELVMYKSDINGIETLTKIIDGYSFDDALEYCLNLSDETFSKSLAKPLVKTFLLIRKEDERVVGALNIRWNYPGTVTKFTGNIGYGIRPSERRKGYNKINLYLGLIEAHKIGLNHVKLVCEKDNIASVKTIESLGGKLEFSEIDPDDNVLTNVYSFDVLDTIHRYINYFN